jgi:hypothetical protein
MNNADKIIELSRKQVGKYGCQITFQYKKVIVNAFFQSELFPRDVREHVYWEIYASNNDPDFVEEFVEKAEPLLIATQEELLKKEETYSMNIESVSYLSKLAFEELMNIEFSVKGKDEQFLMSLYCIKHNSWYYDSCVYIKKGTHLSMYDEAEYFLFYDAAFDQLIDHLQCLNPFKLRSLVNPQIRNYQFRFYEDIKKRKKQIV